ncbi:MAG: methionyl-tRNA formyltransferase [Deltaproteobacteria bacterium]|nr:methionyl-tRNA formyltransferase [Deltaproteobacteria bacterium]
MRLLFIGTADFATATLQALQASSHTIAAVVTQPDRPAGRGQRLRPSPIAATAAAMGIPVLKPESLKPPVILETLRSHATECIVVAAYGMMIPPPLLTLPPHGCVNLHPSLLPKYRGAAPIQHALLNGETLTGVTTIVLVEAMDAGDILLQEKVPIAPGETAPALTDRLARLGASLVVRTLDGLEARQITPRPQDGRAATFAPLLAKDDGRIDWHRPAHQIINQIRALQPWPSAFTRLHGRRLQIFRGEIPEDRRVPPGSTPGTVIAVTRSIHIVTGDGRLCLTELQLEGKRRMVSEELLRGYPVAVGEVCQ